MKKFYTFLFMLYGCAVVAQESTPALTRGKVYVTWGYHRDTYTKSTIHFKGTQSDNYNFTLYHAASCDRIDMYDFFHTAPTVPQYALNIGYMFKKKQGWGIEFSWDHLKYIVRDNQRMHLKGEIRGVYYDKDTLVTPSFVHFEHTNGNNYAMVSAVRQFTLLNSPDRMHSLYLLVKAGTGLLIPKTDSKIMGNHNDGPFQISGFVIGASANLRYMLCSYVYVETSVKAAFADYTHAKLYESGYAKHSFFSLQGITSLGVTFPL